MDSSTFIPQAELVRYSVVLFRVAGIMISAPVLSSAMIAPRVKVMMALAATLALAPTVSARNLPDEISLGTVLASALGELAVGLVIGLAASFVFAALQLAGQIIGFQLGFSLINIIDPQSSVETSVISVLENFVGLMLFLALDGHHWFFTAVNDSFLYLPADGIHLRGPLVEQMIRLSARVLVNGIQIAAPVLCVTIMTDLVLGVIGRTAPLIHVLIVGMPLKVLVGLACLSMAFYFVPQLLGGLFVEMQRDLFTLLRGLA